MNPTDILGKILAGGSSGGILKDIFSGGGSTKSAPPPRKGTSSPPASAPSSSADFDRQIRELEEQLGVGKSPGSAPASRPGNWTPPPAEEIPPPVPKRRAKEADPAEVQDAESLILIRAMIHAVKADGRLSGDEQKALFTELGGQSADAARFLQKELNQPTDVRAFAWSVPIGMEYKVYTISLTAIDLDTKAESAYLAELAHGLRLPMEVREHLHARYGAPAPQQP
jgi:hypothetical protein